MVSSLKYGLKILFFSLLVARCSLLVANSYAQSTKYVRVAIVQDAQSLVLKVSGFYEIIDSRTDKILYRSKNLKTTVTTYKDSILLGKMNFKLDKVLVKADDVDAIVINGRRFRGNIQFIRKNKGRLLAVNYIDLEDYIKGILYHEASHYWPPEALKSQTIACRTFALYQMQENKSCDFDATSDIYSQVYGGKTSERARTNKAVEETKGMVLTYKGNIFPTYYHATCAGKTEDASILWDIDIAPLKGITCNFCKDSPHFRWHAVLPLGEIEDKINRAGYKIKNIKDILILNRDASSRITNLQIITNQNDKEISAKDFRNAIGPNLIRSTNFNLRVVNRDAVFEGLGWGHGVGMCQWGAYFMAKQGYTFEQILQYYYPGCQLLVTSY
jgi:stage II sporulation protein D